MNKKLLSVFFAVLLCVVVSVPAFADTAEDYTPHLIDNADLLTGEEESNLLAKLDEISDRLSVDVAVVTEDSIGDKTPREYADDFYDYTIIIRISITRTAFCCSSAWKSATGT